MSGSLPEMGDWDLVFDESYLRTYLPFLNEERARESTRHRLADGIEPGAEVVTGERRAPRWCPPRHREGAGGGRAGTARAELIL